MNVFASNNWPPTATLALLQQRAVVLRQLRHWFDAQGYWEVETPLLSHDVCVDPWIEPFILPGTGNSGQGTGKGAFPAQMYLQTSPEFGMKRLLAAGATAIYQVTRAFRQEEAGPKHNPEFTIVEWYKVGDDHQQQMNVVESLVRHLGLITKPCVRLGYDEAFAEFAGNRVLSLSNRELVDLAQRHQLSIPASLSTDDRDGWLNLLLAELVEPGLAGLGAVLLYDYPASQSALAKVRPGDPPVAERFELYWEGVELCNGYHELTDPEELARRMELHRAARLVRNLPDLPSESRLLSAMRAGLPRCSGVALGFDRLVMCLLRVNQIQEVIPFPFDIA